MGIETGVDTFKAMDIAEDLIVPMMDHMVCANRDALTLVYAGIYSSFLLFAKRSAQKYNLSSRDILIAKNQRYATLPLINRSCSKPYHQGEKWIITLSNRMQ